MIRIETPEDAYQLDLLHTGLGLPGSATIRYAAAMYFHVRGMICPETLEIYRICSPLDREDAALMLAARGLSHEVHPRQSRAILKPSRR